MELKLKGEERGEIISVLASYYFFFLNFMSNFVIGKSSSCKRGEINLVLSFCSFCLSRVVVMDDLIPSFVFRRWHLQILV